MQEQESVAAVKAFDVAELLIAPSELVDATELVEKASHEKKLELDAKPAAVETFQETVAV